MQSGQDKKFAFYPAPESDYSFYLSASITV